MIQWCIVPADYCVRTYRSKQNKLHGHRGSEKNNDNRKEIGQKDKPQHFQSSQFQTQSSL